MMTNRKKRGVALIIVLGLMALLMLLGVAFSIYMRTERHAAGSYQHDVRARQLLYAAAARALERLEQEPWDKPYPDWLVAVSPHTPLSPDDNPMDLSGATSLPWAQHIPDGVLEEQDFSNAFQQIGWIPVPNGRVAYAIVNLSGLLDANFSGAENAKRECGTNAFELAVTNPVLGIRSRPDFFRGREYESVAEMKALKEQIGLSKVYKWVTFSMTLTNTPLVPVDLSGSANDLAARRDAIRSQLLNPAFIDIFNADQIVDALLDYVDEDHIPRRLDAPLTERNPMFNEILLLPAVDTNSVLLFPFRIELTAPFLKPRPGPVNYQIEYDVTVTTTNVGTNFVTDTGPMGEPFPAPGRVSGTQPVNWNKELFLVVNIPPLGPYSLGPGWTNKTAFFHVHVHSLLLRDMTQGGAVVGQVTNLPLQRPPIASNDLASITIPPLGRSRVGKRAGVEVLDPRYGYQSLFQHRAWYEYWLTEKLVRDAGNPSFSIGQNGTMGLTNAIVALFLSRGPYFQGVHHDGYLYMHVADRPLRSVGELSFLPRGWRSPGFQCAYFTLRLVPTETGMPADPLYDAFTLRSSSRPQRGAINPNTDDLEVLATLFADMPLDAYPGETEDLRAINYRENLEQKIRVNWTDALQLASAWTADPLWQRGFWGSKLELVSNATYRSRAVAIANALAADIPTNPPPSGLSSWSWSAAPLRAEAAVRNILDLLNPRQNYFTILLFAQSATLVDLPGEGKLAGGKVVTVRADQTAMMEVWRDPVPRVLEVSDSTNTYYHRPMFIRRFEILELR